MFVLVAIICYVTGGDEGDQTTCMLLVHVCTSLVHVIAYPRNGLLRLLAVSRPQLQGSGL